MRIQVKRFAEEMEKVLKQNDSHKGGYQTCTYDYLYSRILDEVTELFRAFYSPLRRTYPPAKRNENILKECVDIANFAMMIADKSLKRKALEGK